MRIGRGAGLAMGMVLAATMSAAAATPQRPGASDAGATATRFTRDPARFEANKRKLIAAYRRQSPALGAALEPSFKQDLLTLLAPEFRRLGIRPDDVADMTAAYWVTAWEATNNIVGRQTDPALVRGAARQIAAKLGPGVARLSDAEKQDMADMMLLQTLVADARMKAVASGGAAARQRMSDAIAAEAAELLHVDLRQVELGAAGFTPRGGAAGGAGAPAGAAAPAPPAAPATPGAHAANWAQVEGVYFKSFTSFGVGGVVTQDFEPIVLFRDGRYYEVEGPALEDVDLAASRARSPRAWGQWKRQGDTFLLTDERGRVSDHRLQQGSFFKAFPAEAAGGALERPYKRVSGGGNSALGGTMAIAAQTNIAFTRDGRFSNRSSAGASGANVAAYSRRPATGGRYRVARHTISFTDAGGRTRREFFALGSEGTPARFDTDLIFIGDRVFVKDD
ncbi:DUF6683 family protein [Sphingomonas sp. BK235]|uniref:DUF6683 family protein n=1 Tax=Sphingomonas sp. BK235 TaxID=2512131 RepID=UPI00104E492A|nr:DUF6683 family protein [Sphingomonas sp. BK235]TCP33626.1 hypothetical protein EV292_10575 [Sphingomonas sp. BK235]